MTRKQILKTSYKPYQMIKTATFGHYGTTVNPVTKQTVQGEWVDDLVLHYATTKDYWVQKYTLEGTIKTGTVLIAVQHNESINDDMKVKIGSQVYKIANMATDDSAMYVKYDILTLEKVDKVGGGQS